MAIGTPQFIGSGSDAVASATATAVSTTNAVPSGHHLIALCGAGTGGPVLSSISGGSLTWVVNDTIARGTTSAVGIAIAYCPSGLASSTSITATWSLSGTGHLMGLWSVSGLLTSGTFRDNGVATSIAATTTPTTGSFSTTLADTIIMACRAAADNTLDANWTAGTNYTKCPSGTINQATARTLMCEYRIVSSAASYTASLTQPSIQCSMAATAYKMGSTVVATLLPRRSPQLVLNRR